MKDLWSGRFEKPLDPRIREFTSSLELDKRIAAHDVRGSIAHARMLGRQGIVTPEESAVLVRELGAIAGEISSGAFAWPAEAEDVHSAIEQALRARARDAGRDLHRARPQKCQLALDLPVLGLAVPDPREGAAAPCARARVARAPDGV